MNSIKNIFLVSVYALILLSPVVAGAVTCDENQDGKNEQELLAIEAQCNIEIDALKVPLGETQKQSSEYKKAIADSIYKITKIKLEIKAKNAKIKQLDTSIATTTKYIGQLSDRMDEIKKSIGKMLRDTYSMDDTSIINVLLSSENLSGFFIDTDNYATINQKLGDLIQELTGVKKTSETEKKDLETKQAQESKLKYEQEQAQKTTEGLQKEQQTLLSINVNKEAEYKKLIADRVKLQTQIRNKLYKTASGMEISFGDALKLIQPYESTIGVSSALILAVLFQESAVDSTIGANIGKCTYNQVISVSTRLCVKGETIMSETQKPSYLSIMSNLGLNANTSPVSCAICSAGGHGGAMGPAQFMPLTWDGISKRVSNIIGIAYPSPFENLAAFTAAGVLLKDNQTSCNATYTLKNNRWSCTAARYFAGAKYKSYMKSYGASVLKRALEFEKYIATLSL